jgi:hypothetical protein
MYNTRNVVRGEFLMRGSRSDLVNQPCWRTGHLFYPSYVDLYASRDIYIYKAAGVEGRLRKGETQIKIFGCM